MTGKSATILVVLALVLAPAALAGKGGNGGKPGGGSSSLNLVVLDPDAGGANYGEQVTFDISTTSTDQPSVKVVCSQGGTMVYESSAGFYPEYPWPWLQNFTLSSMAWTGGAADCTAQLYYWNGRRFVTLTSLSFHAYA